LPSLIKDVENVIKQNELRLAKLGEPRSTLSKQQRYLHHISQQFSRVVSYAIEGNYYDNYFQDGLSKYGCNKRIRALVANTLSEFKDDVKNKGHAYKMIGQRSDFCPGSVPSSIRTIEDQRLSQVEQLIKNYRGIELPGFFKPEIITLLFREQCKPWENLIASFATKIFEVVRRGLVVALEDIANQTTYEAILRKIINPALVDLKKGVDEKVKQNLEQHCFGQPITFNSFFTDHLQKLRAKHQKARIITQLCEYFGIGPINQNTMFDTKICISSLADHLVSIREENSMKFACSEALFFMEAYYKVCQLVQTGSQ
jgi:hypothetical protein